MADSPLALVLADIDILLARAYKTSTNLSLLPHSTAVPLTNDLTQHTIALAHALSLLHVSLHGAILVKDVTNRVTDIINALRALLNCTPDEHLVRTATLHDLITNARGPSGIPKDNQTAVYRAWKSDKESLDDNLNEIASIIKHAESNSPQHDEFDDGWSEIGLTDATKLDKDELDRAKSVHQLLRLTTLLHKRIFLDLLPYPSSAPLSAFDSLFAQSSLLLSTSDNIVAALYTPQDPDYIRKEIIELSRVVASLRTHLADLLPTLSELTEQLNTLSIEDAAKPIAKKRADKRWFDTCVDQIARLCTNLSRPSDQTKSPSDAT